MAWRSGSSISNMMVKVKCGVVCLCYMMVIFTNFCSILSQLQNGIDGLKRWKGALCTNGTGGWVGSNKIQDVVSKYKERSCF
jgi:hypothetical protein